MSQSQPTSTHSNGASTTQVLLRLFLSITARTGLFLALAACVVGQWGSLVGTVDFAGYGVQTNLEQPGMLLLIDPSVGGWRLKVGPVKEIDHEHSMFSSSTLQAVRDSPGVFVNSSVPGLVVINPKLFWMVTIRHWLNIAFFVAFNVALWFIFRKRLEIEPCEI